MSTIDMPPVFGADDEIGPDLARVAWQDTPLGPPADWPQSLRTAVSILLSSRFPSSRRSLQSR